MILEKSLNTIFELHSALEHNLFKTFTKRYPLPDKLKSRHMHSIVILHFRERASMSEMSNILNIEKGSFTTVADKLITTGYVINERSVKDKRVYELSLTAKGTDLAEQFVKDHRQYISDLFGKLDEKQLLAFSEALEIVTDTIASLGDCKFKRHLDKK